VLTGRFGAVVLEREWKGRDARGVSLPLIGGDIFSARPRSGVRIACEIRMMAWKLAPKRIRPGIA